MKPPRKSGGDAPFMEVGKVGNDMATKQPLGIMPGWRWREIRIEKLTGAINRYIQSGIIPHEIWQDELAQHIAWLKDRNDGQKKVNEKLEQFND